MSRPLQTRPPLTVHALGLVAATVALLAGGWLMLAPFALGYQPDGADWADATVADFVASLVLLGLGLIAFVVFAASFARLLAPARPLDTRVPPATPTPPSTPTPQPSADDELTALLRPLIAALEEPPTHAVTNNAPGRS